MWQYAKALIATVGVALAAVATAVGNGSLDDLDTGQWLGVAGLTIGSGGLVWLAENVPGTFGGVIKALIAGAGTLVASLTVAYQNDGVISTGEYLTAVAAVITVLVGTYQTPNKQPTG